MNQADQEKTALPSSPKLTQLERVYYNGYRNEFMVCKYDAAIDMCVTELNAHNARPLKMIVGMRTAFELFGTGEWEFLGIL